MFFKARYIIGVGFKILTRTPVPKFSLSVKVNCVQSYPLLQVGCPYYAQWSTRYHLELLYSDEAHPVACAMLETGAMSIRRIYIL